MSSEHHDKTFVRTFVGVIAVLVAVTIFLIILASRTGHYNSGVQSKEMASLQQARAEDNLQPVAKVRLAGQSAPASQSKQAAAPQKVRSGKEVVEAVCSACHAVGAMGAPKIGDKAAWAPRLAQGIDTLLSHAEHGYKNMPPRGGDPSLSNQELHNAIVYMLGKAGLSPKK